MVTVVAVLVSSSPLLGQTQPRASGRDAQLTGLLDRIWWNNTDKIYELNLTDEQRAQMDAHLVDYHSSLSAERPLRRIRAEFSDALISGSWEEAHKLSAELIEGIEHRTLLKNDLKIQVMGLMTGEQRELFATAFPRLLKRPWPRTKTSSSPATVKGRR
jgi:Spy/CpxP family protein refolding chaperone